MTESPSNSGSPVPDGGLPTDLVALVYRELRDLAAQRLRKERRSHTLQPTDLVHEVFLRLQRGGAPAIADRIHFLALASRLMRHILVEHARRRTSAKRGGKLLRVTLDESLELGAGQRDFDLLALDQAIGKLEAVDAEAARVVELLFFGGLTQLEVAEVMERSERWVRGQWAFARAWLRRELSSGGADDPATA